MLLVFLFLLIFIIFIILGIIFSKIEIDGNFKFDNLHNKMINNIDSTNYSNDDSNKENKNYNKKTNSLNYQVYINMYLYKSKYLRLMKIKIDSKYLKLYKYKIKTKEAYIDILKKVDMNKIIKSFKIKYLKIIKMNLKKVILHGEINTRNDFLTMHLVTFLSVVLFNIIGYLSFKNSEEDVKEIDVDIKPIFEFQNFYSLFYENDKKFIKCNFNLKITIDLETISLLKFAYKINKNMKVENRIK